MFDLLGRVVHRGWFLFLSAWAVTFVSGWLLAPQWIHVAQDWESGFLPPDSPSVVASDVYRKAFPQQPLGSNIVVVLVDEEPNRLDRDRAFVQDVLEPRLRQIAEAEGGIGDQPRPSDEPLFSDETKTSVPKRSAPVVARIRTPNAPGAGALLTSADQRALGPSRWLSFIAIAAPP